jgi:hypothetical protein
LVYVEIFSFRIEYTVSAKNGGEVLYEDRSSFQRPYLVKPYFLNGIITTESLELGFDIYPPVHCFEQSDDCKKDALKATDFLTQVLLAAIYFRVINCLTIQFQN